MCNLCENFQKSARHLAERADVLVGKWTGSRLVYSQAVTHSMAQLIFALRKASESLDESTFANLEDSHSLFDRALATCMLENQPEGCSTEEKELVVLAEMFDAQVDQCVDGLGGFGGLLPGHKTETDQVAETDQVH